MENLELAYESRGSRNYLSVKATDELSSFQAKMLENNDIPCLLPMRSRSMNGVYCLDYDITGKNRLVDALESRQIRGEKAKKVLWDLLEGLLGTEEYFLTYAQCVLDLQYIFYSDNEELGLVYLPLKDVEITNQDTVKDLFQDLLVNYLSEENEQFFMDLLRYVSRRDFSVPGLYKLVKDAVETPAVAVQQPAQTTAERPAGLFNKPAIPTPAPALAQEQDFKTRKLFDRPEPKATPAPAAPVTPPPMASAGFAIPGAGPAIPPAAPAPAAKPEKEKKPLFSFGGGSKKEKPAAPATPPPMVMPGMPPAAPTPAAPAPAPQKQKGGLFGGKSASAPAPAPTPAPTPATPATDQWRGTVMMSNDVGSGKTIMLGGGGNFPFLRHAGNTINLDHFPFVIGKQNADYVISKGVISRTHATIISRDGSYFVKDENSSNHTYVNGVQIPPFTEREIVSGDRIRLADEELEFNVEG